MPLDKNLKNKTFVKRKRPLILVTNDDGVSSPGIKALAASLKKVGDVIVVAPATEQSATSHSVTLHRAIRCYTVAPDIYAVEGTPADCVNLAINFLLKGHMPDMLFSGINKGPNMGDDIHYSGTVSAAVEGRIIGIPSIAVSVAGPLWDTFEGNNAFRFDSAAIFSLKIARKLLKERLPNNIILNINVPNLSYRKIKGCRVTFQGVKNYSDVTTEQISPRGDKFYWISGREDGFEDIEGSDCNAVAEKYISLTPLRIDMTDRGFMSKMKKWRF